MDIIRQFQEFQIGGMAESSYKGWYQDVIDAHVANGQLEEAEKLAQQFMDDYNSGKGIRNPE